METAISLISDLCILIFDLALYASLTILKKENKLYRGIMYGGVVVITAAYVISAYVFHVPYSIASFACMTVPSFLLFLSLSRFKNARFLVTFCFVDTVTFIIAAIAKCILILCGSMGGLISCIVLIVLCLSTYFFLKPYCPKYRELTERVAHGWVPMAISVVLIYILLIVSTAYPKPMIQRMEYVPVFLLLCVTVLSFDAVFLILIDQKSQLARANVLLQQQQRWHDLAYLDELTQLANPASYAARTEEIEKEAPTDHSYALMIFDVDNFKHVNDTYGHHYGNIVLKNTASFFLKTFPETHYEFFRIGGDEFAAIVKDVLPKDLSAQTLKINRMPYRENPGCTYSCGCAQVDFSSEKPFEQAFIQADQAMYAVKTRKKQEETPV